MLRNLCFGNDVKVLELFPEVVFRAFDNGNAPLALIARWCRKSLLIARLLRRGLFIYLRYHPLKLVGIRGRAAHDCREVYMRSRAYCTKSSLPYKIPPIVGTTKHAIAPKAPAPATPGKYKIPPMLGAPTSTRWSGEQLQQPTPMTSKQPQSKLANALIFAAAGAAAYVATKQFSEEESSEVAPVQPILDSGRPNSDLALPNSDLALPKLEASPGTKTLETAIEQPEAGQPVAEPASVATKGKIDYKKRLGNVCAVFAALIVILFFALLADLRFEEKYTTLDASALKQVTTVLKQSHFTLTPHAGALQIAAEKKQIKQAINEGTYSLWTEVKSLSKQLSMSEANATQAPLFDNISQSTLQNTAAVLLVLLFVF